MPRQRKVFIDHHVAQAWGVDSQLLNSRKKLLATTLKVARELNLTTIDVFVHKFRPHGLSIVLVIAESHFAIHTWPELGYMNIDVLSCSPNSRLEALAQIITDAFNPKKLAEKKIRY